MEAGLEMIVFRNIKYEALFHIKDSATWQEELGEGHPITTGGMWSGSRGFLAPPILPRCSEFGLHCA